MSAWEQTPEYTELEQIFSEQTTKKIGLTAEQLNIILHNIRYLKNHLGLADVEMGVIETIYTEPGTPFDVVITHREESQGEGLNKVDYFDFKFYIAVAKITTEATAETSDDVNDIKVELENTKLSDMKGYNFKFKFTIPRGKQGVKGVSFRNKGTYDNETIYVNNDTYIDYVHYNGSLYCPNIAEVVGHLPTETDCWTLMVAKGDKGISITGVTKIKTEGLIDTYQITYSEGESTTFEIVNGETPDVSNKENISNKITTIDSSNKTSETKYPCVKAVVGYVDSVLGEMATLLSEV